MEINDCTVEASKNVGTCSSSRGIGEIYYDGKYQAHKKQGKVEMES